MEQNFGGMEDLIRNTVIDVLARINPGGNPGGAQPDGANGGAPAQLGQPQDNRPVAAAGAPAPNPGGSSAIIIESPCFRNFNCALKIATCVAVLYIAFHLWFYGVPVRIIS